MGVHGARIDGAGDETRRTRHTAEQIIGKLREYAHSLFAKSFSCMSLL